MLRKVNLQLGENHLFELKTTTKRSVYGKGGGEKKNNNRKKSATIAINVVSVHRNIKAQSVIR